MIPILLASMWLGARNLNARMIWDDERYSLVDAGAPPFPARDLAGVWQGVAERNPHHTPGYYLVLNLWGRLVGWQPPMLRALSLIFGLLTAVWTYRLGRDFVSPRVGLYAALALVTSALFVYYERELRMYTLHACLCVFTLWVYLRIVRARYRVGWLLWLGLLVGATAMLYTDYVASVPLVAIVAYHLLLAPKAPSWWRPLVVIALAGVLYLPWLRVTVQAFGIVVNDDPLHLIALTPWQSLTFTLYEFSNGATPLLLVLLVLGIIPAFRSSVRANVRRLWIFALGVLAVLLALNAALKFMTEDRARYLLVVFPLLALLAALGFAQLEALLARIRLRPVLIFALGVWVLLGVTNRGLTADLYGEQYIYPMHQLAPVLRPFVQPGDALIHFLPEGLQVWNHRVFADYYFGAMTTAQRLVESKPGDVKQQKHEQSITDEFVRDHDRVWLASMDGREPAPAGWLRDSLTEDGYALCQPPLDPPGAHVDQFVRDSVCCATEQTLANTIVRFGDGIRLSALGPIPAHVSGALRLTLGWSLAADVPLNTYSVGLHVLDAEGNLVAQADYGLGAQTFDCRAQIIDTSALKPGHYDLSVLVYAWQTGQRLPGTSADGTTGDRLRLGSFEAP